MARASADPPLTLTETAARLGVHYMTAYKYVRTGRLEAHKSGQEWLVRPQDLAAFERAQQAPRARGARRSSYPAELQDRMLHGDEPGAWAVVERALSSGMEPAGILLDLMGPAMAGIGDEWERGTITVAQEHQASGIANRVIGRLGPRFVRRGRKRGHVIVGAAPLDEHGLPTAIVRDLVQGHALAVTDLGANVPVASWASTVRAAAAGSPALVAVGLCATTGGHRAELRAAISAIRAETGAPIVLGGHAITSAAAARRLGADHYSATAADAVSLLAVGARAT
jgi:excisionase family DNA binding protein